MSLGGHRLCHRVAAEYGPGGRFNWQSALSSKLGDVTREDIGALFSDCSNEEITMLIRLAKLIKMEIVTYTESLQK